MPFVISNGLTVVRCRGCGLLYVNPRLPAEEIANHFQEEYIASDERVERDFISLREASLVREAALIRKLCPGGGRLVDVGCASGEFLRQFFGDSSWQVEGVEPSRFAAEYARRALEGVRVFNGVLPGAGFGTGEFDVVTYLDTFYFIPKPNEEAREVARILKPGGLLAVEIPGLRFRLLKNAGLLCRLLYREPARLNARIHLYFYSRDTLTRLVAKHGFKPVAWYPEQSPLYGPLPVRWLNSLYFRTSAAIAAGTRGRVNLVPKEFIVYRKED